jgi:hypothetical protein
MIAKCFVVSGEGGIIKPVIPMPATIIKGVSIDFTKLGKIVSGAAIIELSSPISRGLFSSDKMRYGVIDSLLVGVPILEIKKWPVLVTLYDCDIDDTALLSTSSIDADRLTGIDRIFLCRSMEEAKGSN